MEAIVDPELNPPLGSTWSALVKVSTEMRDTEEGLLLGKFYNQCHFDVNSFDQGFCLLPKWQVRAINQSYTLPLRLSLVRG